MKIGLCSIGSRGDIQPFLVLGEYLGQQGHEVKVVSAEMYADLAANYGVDYVAFEGNYKAIIDDEAMKKEIGRNPFTIGKQLREKVYPIIENSLETFYEILQWADVVLYHPKTLLDSIGYEMPHKLIKAYVVPAFTPTRAFANPILNFLPLPQFFNKLTYKLANALINTVKTPVNNFKQKNKLAKSKSMIDTPVVYGLSPSFLPRPADYPQNHYFTGFWKREQDSQEIVPAVTQFMAGEKEVLILTFGSMPYKSNTNVNDFIQAILKEQEIKVLVVRGWGLKEVEIKLDENVMAIDAAPFDALFPLADYVLHHGGAGTTAIALQSGIPQMICPVLHPFGDQYFWGKQVEKIGVGAEPIPLKKLTVKKLLRNLAQLMQEELTIEAKKMQQQLLAENGLETCKIIVEKIYERQTNRSTP